MADSSNISISADPTDRLRVLRLRPSYAVRISRTVAWDTKGELENLEHVVFQSKTQNLLIAKPSIKQ